MGVICKQKKRELRRQRRIRDWEEMMARPSRESAVQLRKETGGYRRPGSFKR